MGVNVQKAAQKAFQKKIDAAIEAVLQGDLFDQTPSACDRRFLAEPAGAQIPKVDDTVRLELVEGVLIGTRGPLKVLSAENPPADIVDHIRANSGLATGTISEVNALSGNVEVELC